VARSPTLNNVHYSKTVSTTMATTTVQTTRPKKDNPRLDRWKTIANYLARMKAKPRTFFEPLRNAYLCCFEIHSTVKKKSECSKFILQNVFAVQLMFYVRGELRIPVAGVTSERSKHDEFVCSERADRKNKCVYVGKAAQFADKDTSPYAPIKADLAFYEDDESGSETTFAVEL
jgi:hypothetical protein